MNSTITLREALLADTSAITALLEACALGPAGVLSPGSRYWVAEDGNRIIGVVGLEYGPAAVLLRSAAVAPSHRRRGIGSMLLHEAMQQAAASGIPTIYLFSTDAGDYWQSQQFQEVSVPELVAALPDAFQVRHYHELGWLPTEVAWRHDIESERP